MKQPLPAGYAFSPHLPKAAIAALRKAEPSPSKQSGAMQKAFDAVGYPKAEVGPRADVLTPAQRAVAEFVTEHDLQTSDNDRDQWMPATRATRRRWVGIDPPGELEALVTFELEKATLTEPLWRALRLLDVAGKDAAAKKLVAKMPLERRLRLWVETYDCWYPAYGLEPDLFFDADDPKALAKLGADARDWAAAFADARIGMENDYKARYVIFLALVRAGIPIEPRWDEHLPLGFGVFAKLVLECVRAIPEERRSAAVVAAMRREPSWESFSTAELLMGHVPGAEIVEYALSKLTKADRVKVEKLHAASAKNPAARAAIERFMGKLPPERVLATFEARKPKSAKELDATAKKQLQAAGKRYHGRVVPLGELLAVDRHSEVSLMHVLAYRAIGDAKGKHLYDAWEYAGDSGTIFHAGTTKRVAEIIQGDVECDDPALNSALTVALRQKAAKKAAAAKRAPTARAARRS